MRRGISTVAIGSIAVMTTTLVGCGSDAPAPKSAPSTESPPAEEQAKGNLNPVTKLEALQAQIQVAQAAADAAQATIAKYGELLNADIPELKASRAVRKAKADLLVAGGKLAQATTAVQETGDALETDMRKYNEAVASRDSEVAKMSEKTEAAIVELKAELAAAVEEETGAVEEYTAQLIQFEAEREAAKVRFASEKDTRSRTLGRTKAMVDELADEIANLKENLEAAQKYIMESNDDFNGKIQQLRDEDEATISALNLSVADAQNSMNARQAEATAAAETLTKLEAEVATLTKVRDDAVEEEKKIQRSLD